MQNMHIIFFINRWDSVRWQNHIKCWVLMYVCTRASSHWLNSCLSRHTIHYNLVNRFSALSYYRWHFMMIFVSVIWFSFWFYLAVTNRASSRAQHWDCLRFTHCQKTRENHPLNANMAIFDSIKNVKSELKALILFPVATIFVIGTMLKLIVRGLNRMCALYASFGPFRNLQCFSIQLINFLVDFQRMLSSNWWDETMNA